MARNGATRTLRAINHGGDLSPLRGLGDGPFGLLNLVHVAGDFPLLFVDGGGGCQAIRFGHIFIFLPITL